MLLVSGVSREPLYSRFNLDVVRVLVMIFSFSLSCCSFLSIAVRKLRFGICKVAEHAVLSYSVAIDRLGLVAKSPKLHFLPFLAAQNSSQTQTFKYMSRAHFSS